MHSEKKLLQRAMTYLERAHTYLEPEDSEALHSVTDFLKSCDHSFFNRCKLREEKIKAAVRKLSMAFEKKLNHSDWRDIDIMMKAAVELKWTIHESWLAHIRREGGCTWHLVDPVTLITKGLSLHMPIFDWFALGEWIKNQEIHRRTLFQTVYKKIIVEKLGVIKPHCECLANNCSEIAAFKKAMMMHYDATGHLIAFSDMAANEILFSSSAYTLSSLSNHHKIQMQKSIASNDNEKEIKLRVSAASIASFIEYKTRTISQDPIESRSFSWIPRASRGT